jgi:hypothetical protein
LSLQYLTCAQLRAQLLRQVMGLAHTAQGFCGNAALFPLNPV